MEIVLNTKNKTEDDKVLLQLIRTVDLDELEILDSKASDVQIYGLKKIFYYVAEKGYKLSVKELLPQVTENEIKEALDRAVRNRHTEIAKLLVAAGGDAQRSIRYVNDVETLNILMGYGAVPYNISYNIEKGNHDVVRKILESTDIRANLGLIREALKNEDTKMIKVIAEFL